VSKIAHSESTEVKLPMRNRVGGDGRLWPVAEPRAARRVRLRMGTCRGAPLALASTED
jgi:hypothetical protein